MKVDLTKEQYEQLLKVVYLGNWMATLPQEECDADIEGIGQFVFSLAADFGFQNYIGYDNDTKEHFPTEEFERKTNVIELIMDYNTYTVYQELVLTLARRDLVKQYGGEAVEAMSETEMVEKEYPILMKYQDEFQDNGLANLVISGT
jgi:hypothetical protein